jgi:L-threonylcarbamoyladenylate synthase
VASPEEAAKLWLATPKSALALMQEFWPGPLTLVLPKSPRVPDVVTSGLPTVAVRMPKNHHALSLIIALGHPIAAPSANLFGYTSPTSAAHVFEDLGEQVDLVLDGGDSVVGLESTVLKFEEDAWVLLRPGAVTPEQIEKIVPLKKISKAVSQAPESPVSWKCITRLGRPCTC